MMDELHCFFFKFVITDMDPADPSAVETEGKDRASFYTNAAEYWSTVPATVDGVLGGFGFISHTDIQGSVSFLKKLFKVG
jgi:protein N-terminal methyltransferase